MFLKRMIILFAEVVEIYFIQSVQKVGLKEILIVPRADVRVYSRIAKKKLIVKEN